MQITIVTPSYNQGTFLEETLRSVIGQEGIDLDYIVIDGGSTDGSGEILERYADRIAYLQRQPDGGQTDALIQGFERARGEVMGWLNADDLLEPGALAEVAAHFSDNPSDRFIFGDSTWIDEHGGMLRRKREMPFVRSVWLRTYDYIPQPSAFWRSDLYREVGGLDPSFEQAMDADLFARFADRTRPRHVRRFWSRMRSHAGQKNVRLRARSNEEEARIRSRYLRVTRGPRWALERAVARLARIGWRAAIGGYW